MPTMGRLLIVDDEVELMMALLETLTQQGYEAKGFTSGSEALAELRKGSYDLLLADLMMPNMDGITLLRHCLELDPHLVSVIMTGQGTVQTAVEAMRSGAYDYILKPFKLQALLPVLDRAMETRRLRLENIQLRDTVGIYSLSQTIALTLDVQVMLEKTVDAALAQSESDEASVLIKQGNDLTIAAVRGANREQLLGKRVGLKSGVVGWVAANNESVILNGPTIEDIRFSPSYVRDDIHSAVVVPMTVAGQQIGVLSVSRLRPRAFTSGQVKALSVLANTSAAALENARLFTETNRRLHYLQALSAIDAAISASLDLQLTLNILLEQITMRLQVDAVDILLLDQYSHSLEYAAGRGFQGLDPTRMRQRLGEGMAGRAALERRMISETNAYQLNETSERARVFADERFVAFYSVPLIAKGQVKGVLEIFNRSELRPDDEWLEFLASLANQAAIAIDNGQLFENLQRSNTEISLAYDATIEGWSRALDLREEETQGHTQRVTEMTLHLARTMGVVPEADLIYLRWGALLHDIGKMAIPDDILCKEGELSSKELEVMHKHPTHAHTLLSPITYLQRAIDIPYCHHEKWDGTGYPRGLKAEQIPIAARIFAVVDEYDTLRYGRSSGSRRTEGAIREHIRSLSGTAFDPSIVDVFLSHF